MPPRVWGDLVAVWGDRDDDIWAVGTNGLIVHWDGTAWRKEESGVVEQLSSVHGAGGHRLDRRRSRDGPRAIGS